MCTVLLPPIGYLIAVKYIVSYQNFSVVVYFNKCYHLINNRLIDCNKCYHLINNRLIDFNKCYHLISTVQRWLD